MITIEFIQDLSTNEKLECLPENLPLEKDSGRWLFFDSFQEPVYTQRISETLDCFLDRVLFDIAKGGRGCVEQIAVSTNLSTVEDVPDSHTSKGYPVYKFS